jgi:hypothetical protein
VKGLIIESTPIEKILAGRKTWEMRTAPTKVRGTIALIRKGSGQVVGLAELVDSQGPLNPDDIRNNQAKHQIEPDRQSDPKLAKYRYAWVLQRARRLEAPLSYEHPSGAVIWVQLNETVAGKLAGK